MLVPELIPDRHWMRPALEARAGGAWQLVREGEWRARALTEAQAQAQIRRALSCSLVVARRRHEAIWGPLLGVVASEPLRQLVLVEASSLEARSPWEGEALEPVFRSGLEATLWRLSQARPGWPLRLPPELEALLKHR